MNNNIEIIDEEIKIKNKEIFSETDAKGKIIFVNEYFCEIAGYEEAELVGEPHSIVRHPDMPKVVFKILWDNLKNGNKFSAIIKNLRSDGRYYWVYSTYEPLFDIEGKIRGFRSYRKPVAHKHVVEFSELYKKLSSIENKKSIEDAQTFLELKLDHDGYIGALAYKEFVDEIYNNKLSKVFSKIFGFLK